MIIIELFGVPRLRAGTGRVALDAATIAGALGQLGRVCPDLEGTVLRAGRVDPAYQLCLNGDRFVTDPTMALAEGDVLLLLAVDAGG